MSASPGGLYAQPAVCHDSDPIPPCWRNTAHEHDDLPLAPLPPTPLGRYRHYKGGEYEVMGVARHSETLAPLVVYRPLYNDSGWWVRPHDMFFGTVWLAGVETRRFTPTD